MNHSVKSLPNETFASPAGREALRIIERLRHAGFFAVFAGGCVRDALIGRIPKDFDVATEATPESVREVFGKRNTLAFGASFGVIGVLPSRTNSGPDEADKDRKLVPTEVATFRADGNYSDGRRPDSVTYGNAEADALRRDFTINGMFYDPVAGKVLDYVGGLRDVEDKHLRTIGEASRRFDEDKLRMLRAVRFVTTLGLTLEASTLSAIQEHADSLSVVSGERIGAEMRRVVTQTKGDRGLRLLVETRLVDQVWPALVKTDWKILEAVYERMVSPSFEVAMASTLSVIHSNSSLAIKELQSLARRWKLSVVEQRAITSAINYSGFILGCESAAWSKLQPILIDRDVKTIVGTAEALATADTIGDVGRARKELQRSPDSLDPPPLLTGADLIAAGYPTGPNFRDWLEQVRRMQLDDELNNRADAMRWIQSQP